MVTYDSTGCLIVPPGADLDDVLRHLLREHGEDEVRYAVERLTVDDHIVDDHIVDESEIDHDPDDSIDDGWTGFWNPL